MFDLPELSQVVHTYNNLPVCAVHSFMASPIFFFYQERQRFYKNSDDNLTRHRLLHTYSKCIFCTLTWVTQGFVWQEESCRLKATTWLAMKSVMRKKILTEVLVSSVEICLLTECNTLNYWMVPNYFFYDLIQSSYGMTTVHKHTVIWMETCHCRCMSLLTGALPTSCF